ncbi:hypothetical protein SAMN02745166_00984 [Prosthecobacter debontii]|uniref:Uncharacterized protein n=1 Tax=Prosthecobacter debontii TaxID=48467 RepID=A0A1T4X3D3_9BACT|nr:hypothetical protein SAMN02745166_00984 [Prosthecobacter debontii]
MGASRLFSAGYTRLLSTRCATCGPFFRKEALNLGLGELLPAAFLQILKLQPTDAGAGQTLDFEAQLIKHQADLSFQTLLQDHMSTILSDHPCTLSLGMTFFGQHTFDQLSHGGLVHGLIHDHLIFLLGSHAGVDESVGELAAIGHQQQTFTVFVQTSHMVEGLKLLGQQGVDRHAIFLITSATNVTAWLVQSDHNARFGFHRFPICHHSVVWIDLSGEIGNDVSIDGHAAFKNELLAATAGTEAALAEVTIESHRGRRGLPAQA